MYTHACTHMISVKSSCYAVSGINRLRQDLAMVACNKGETAGNVPLNPELNLKSLTDHFLVT